jgi:septum formation protein
MTSPNLILASTSPTRVKLLTNAGLKFLAQAAQIDETHLQRHHEKLAVRPLALELARAKALSLSAFHGDAVIIGSDQTLELDGSILHKAGSLEAARAKLVQLRGKSHHLHSAVACVRGGKIVFEHVSTATLTMRNFGDEFLDHYLNAAKDEVLSAVGCYFFEGRGIQLFEKVEGDYHTILGLPLLPLLAFLRQSAIVQA